MLVDYASKLLKKRNGYMSFSNMFAVKFDSCLFLSSQIPRYSAKTSSAIENEVGESSSKRACFPSSLSCTVKPEFLARCCMRLLVTKQSVHIFSTPWFLAYKIALSSKFRASPFPRFSLRTLIPKSAIRSSLEFL